ncbi:UbiA family prenyltransferase [Kiritimatiella glycovorans]|uniref:UbiA prenyltransferase n=1 Tax=Kiritimatiella glycovorans TaxID=1307763 RepID=A0A0G3EFX2_9BACT|nr:UbiA family prenyltransferase [Kiritimatiella glycovorans]AKJ65268.1 UbiA prenyltransferase [Kiritimatiella glycovorans]
MAAEREQGAFIPPLYVDLDGTLIRSDVFLEAGLQFLSRRPSGIAELGRRARAGRPGLKRWLAEVAELDVDALPWQTEFIAWLRAEKKRGRRLVLATAADGRIAHAVADHLGCFDAVLASDGEVNLKGAAKRDRILEHCGGGPFAYAGDSNADRPVWKAAAERIAVRPSPGLGRWLRRHSARVFAEETVPRPSRSWPRALRVFQWMKNLLVFAPMILAHRLGDPALYLAGITAFISFSLLASSVYVMNDLADLEADRRHPRKRRRPFASGALNPGWGLLAAPLLLLGALLTALALPPAFAGWAGLYVVLNLAYSWGFKRIFLLDVLTLAVFYTLRFAAGSAATGVPCSLWFVAFSLAGFMSLAFVKRYAELREVKEANTHDRVKGRGYRVRDLGLLLGCGVAMGAAAVGVFCAYLASAQVSTLYARPFVLWGVAALMVGWLGRIWLLAKRGVLRDDPVEFALTDRVTWVLAALAAALVLIAA